MYKLISEITLSISKINEKRCSLMKTKFNAAKHNYSFSEMHTIDYIGKNELPNVTKIARHLGMTRGAISKVTKKLLRNKHVESFKLDTNKKEVYFRLTARGRELFNEHDNLHHEFTKIDFEYFKNIDAELLAKINFVLGDFDEFLSDQAERYKK